jgi:hypothetical protein
MLIKFSGLNLDAQAPLKFRSFNQWNIEWWKRTLVIFGALPAAAACGP